MRTLSENPPLSHVTTFGGHPVCCAAGLAALDFLIENKLPERAERLGQYLRDRLNTLSRIGGVKDVRGKGLLIGFELNNANLTKRFATNCRDAGLILGWTLHSNTVVRLAPPLIITEAELDQGLEIMREALSRATDQ
jgi:4-aminobutyrate aminotransferase-like enzyme